jgi:DNA-binding NtrC family response regulator
MNCAKTTLLAVSANEDDLRSLRDILDDSQWIVRSAQSCTEARRWMEREKLAVVACQRTLPDGSWRDLYNLTTSLADPPPVVVVSRHADEKLWAEVLNLGGYDVLASPFEKDEVARVMEMASRHGRQVQSG